MAKRSAGISGVGVLFITMGTYLIYIGIKDVGFTEGLQDIFQNRKLPESRSTGKFEPIDIEEAGLEVGAGLGMTNESSQVSRGASIGESIGDIFG